jgi:molybdate/tungstate transport system substrate-binding protein
MTRTAAFNRRTFLRNASFLSASLALSPTLHLAAQQLATLNVASAGSIRAMLEGPLKLAAAHTLSLDLHTHAQGADTVAVSLIDGTLTADLFIPITAHPMLTVLNAGKATTAQPIARTELVLLYSPKSRFLPQFEQAAAGTTPWYEVLQQPGLRIARSNPATDPGGRAILFLMMLAAKKYNQPDLVAKVLGTPLNPDQVLTGGNTQAKLQAGEIDVMAVYKIGPAATNQPFLTLPADINLSSSTLRQDHPDISLAIGPDVFYPEPLIFYAAQLKDTANPSGAAAFLTWLQSPEAQSLFQYSHFAPIGDATPIHLSAD